MRVAKRKTWVALALACSICSTLLAAEYDGKLTVTVTDEATGKPIPVRMELRNGRGRPMRIKAEGIITREDYLVFNGEIALELPQDSYHFFLEAGPEFHTREGHFKIERNSEDNTAVTLKRHENMAEHGWWAGDLDVQQRHDDMPLLMRAEGVSLAPELAAENVKGRCRKERTSSAELYGPKLWLDYGRGGGLLFISAKNSETPGFDLCQLKADEPTVSALTSASGAGIDVVALSADAWDLPLWVATDKLTAVQIMNRYTMRGMRADEGSHPRERQFAVDKVGGGRSNEAIYHQLLNCGIRISPAAGSGAGANKSAIGVNRTYVHCGDEYSPVTWLEGLRAGWVVVTNGPLLRTTVEGQPPGHVFHLDGGQPHKFQISLSLSFYEKARVEYLEIVKNGRVEESVRLDELAKQSGELPALEFNESGWFLVRAVANSSESYQYASTGPYYVEANDRSRISRASVEYFLKWLDDAKEKFAGNEAVLADIAAARPFWEDLLSKAKAE